MGGVFSYFVGNKDCFNHELARDIERTPALSIGNHLEGLSEPPPEALKELQRLGFPPLRTARKLKTSFNETFLLEFDGEIPGSSMKVEAPGDRSKAILQVLAAQMGDKALFSMSLPLTGERIWRAHELAAECGVRVPKCCAIGTCVRGDLNGLPWIVEEYINTETVEDKKRAPREEFDRIRSAVVKQLSARPVGKDASTLLPYFGTYELLAELRSLASAAGATELLEPLQKLESECRERWKVEATAPMVLVHQDVNGGNLLCSSVTDGGGKWQLDALIDWESAAVGDIRIANGSDEPWSLIRKFAHVVKARHLCWVARCTPDQVLRCELEELLENHDEAHEELVEKGWLKAKPPPPPKKKVSESSQPVPAAPKGTPIFSRKWRVCNAEKIKDHWNIGEMVMLTADGSSTHGSIKSVICSHNYDGHDLACVHNGEFNTEGHANPSTWAGDDRSAGKVEGGSWLGYEFASEQNITSVRLAQGEQRFPGFQSVATAWLDVWLDNKWQRVGTLSFTKPDDMAIIVQQI